MELALEPNSFQDGFIYTFENSLTYSESSSEDFEDDIEFEDYEATPKEINKTQRLWNRGTLWIHDLSPL